MTKIALRMTLTKGYLVSDTQKGPVRLKFNTHFMAWLFPELVPESL